LDFPLSVSLALLSLFTYVYKCITYCLFSFLIFFLVCLPLGLPGKWKEG
jgi:hypothetical protein